LWSPAFLTYVTAPATWFLPDVLAATALDVTTHTMFLAPTVGPNETAVELPLFFPSFWATVKVARSGPSDSGINGGGGGGVGVGGGGVGGGVGGGGGTIVVEVTKSFGVPVVIKRIVAQPVGKPTAEGSTVELTAPFVASAGNMLDLSAHWTALVAAQLRPAVLPPDSRGFLAE
jgi:hypothetical protein